MNLDANKIKFLKLNLAGYWVAVTIAFLMFMDTTLGYYLVLSGQIIFAVHIIELFVFNKALEKYSDNLMKDRLMILPFGFLVPAELKAAKNN